MRLVCQLRLFEVSLAGTVLQALKLKDQVNFRVNFKRTFFKCLYFENIECKPKSGSFRLISE